jgi:hypothetical protein
MFDGALSDSARDVLRGLDSELDVSGFYLAGGSGLALQLGHRVSEDLDFFTPRTFAPDVLSRYLETKGAYQETLVSPGTLYCRLNAVKLSFILYPVPLSWPVVTYHSSRVADWRDIMAEKFKTLSQRGSRKDFYDIYAAFAVGNLTIAQGVEFLRRRFDQAGLNYYHVLKSLVFFDDAETEPEPILLKPLDWSHVKDFFVRHLAEFETELLRAE